MKYVVTWQGREIVIEMRTGSGGVQELEIDGRPVTADLCPAGGDSLHSLIMDDRSYDVSVVGKEDLVQVTIRGRQLGLLVESEQERNARLVAGTPGGRRAHTVKSQMPGIVTRILARQGEDVQSGSALLILEAMKMENEVRALHDGSVERILVSEGQTVNAGDELVIIR